jgi:hypothetical protein
MDLTSWRVGIVKLIFRYLAMPHLIYLNICHMSVLRYSQSAFKKCRHKTSCLPELLSLRTTYLSGTSYIFSCSAFVSIACRYTVNIFMKPSRYDRITMLYVYCDRHHNYCRCWCLQHHVQVNNTTSLTIVAVNYVINRSVQWHHCIYQRCEH